MEAVSLLVGPDVDTGEEVRAKERVFIAELDPVERIAAV